MKPVHKIALPLFASLASATLSFVASAADSGDRPSFNLPLNCKDGPTCFIQNRVDMDLGEARLDALCGRETYNGHKGTDIRVSDTKVMQKGIDILAMADGTVVGLRNSSPDKLIENDEHKAAVKGKECGNGVALDHGDGWVTQYCHLKSGSIAVGKGQRVAAGSLLGHVGQSGATEFPHLHMSVRQGKRVVDPFTGSQMGAGCSVARDTPLWAENVQAMLPQRDAPMLFAVGFRSSAALYDAILQDMRSPAVLPVAGSGLVFWGMAYGLRAGDVLEFRVLDPAGGMFVEQRFQQKKNRIWRMQFVGRTNKNGILRTGRYTGRVRVIRQQPNGSSLVVERRAAVELVE